MTGCVCHVCSYDVVCDLQHGFVGAMVYWVITHSPYLHVGCEVRMAGRPPTTYVVCCSLGVFWFFEYHHELQSLELALPWSQPQLFELLICIIM